MPRRWLVAVMLVLGFGVARAGIPAGGLDLFGDEWARQGHDLSFPDPRGPGPFRIAAYALDVGGINNNSGTASTTAFALATERSLSGPYFYGGSFGGGESASLKWSHVEAHGGILLSERVAFRIGVSSDIFDFLANKTFPTNVARNVAQGLELGIDIFGSPRPGWFIQLCGDVVPLKAELVNQSSREDPAYSLRGGAMLGFTVWEHLDASVFAMTMSSLGDTRSYSSQLGAALSATF